MGKHSNKFFVYGLLRLRSLNEKVTFDDIEKNLSEGIATYLTKRFDNIFKDVGYDNEANGAIDKICKNYSSFSGDEDRKFGIANEDGIMFLLALFVNYDNLKISFDDLAN